MLATLLPLHEMMHKQGPTTLKEIAFVQVRPRGGTSHVWKILLTASLATVPVQSRHRLLASPQQLCLLSPGMVPVEG